MPTKAVASCSRGPRMASKLSRETCSAAVDPCASNAIAIALVGIETLDGVSQKPSIGDCLRIAVMANV